MQHKGKEREAGQEAAEEGSNAFFQLAFRCNPQPCCILRESDAVCLEANDRFVEWAGATRDALIGERIFNLRLWPDESTWRSTLEQFGSDDFLEVERPVHHLNGEVQILLIGLQRFKHEAGSYIIASLTDVTASRQSAEEESQALLYKIFHASPAAISISRIDDGRLIDVNQEWCRLTGYSREVALMQTPEALGLWEAQDALPVERLEEASIVHDAEVTIRSRDGEVYTALCSFQCIQVKEDMCLLAVFNDITDRKQAELELLQAKNRAEEMSRMKMVFLTNMTHEVRTPLTVILGFTSMLQRGVKAEYRRFVRVIERSGRRLLLMLDSILDLAQLEAGTLEIEDEPFDLIDMLYNLLEEVEDFAREKNLTLKVDLPDHAVLVPHGFKIVQRILNNLLDNAIKFTEEGHIGLSVRCDEQQVALLIEDTGVGIDEGFLPHIFDEFSQESTGLERTHQGSGLGLAVSQRLIELVGGSIHVESTKGQGSRFEITLPRVVPELASL